MLMGKKKKKTKRPPDPSKYGTTSLPSKKQPARMTQQEILAPEAEAAPAEPEPEPAQPDPAPLDVAEAALATRPQPQSEPEQPKRRAAMSSAPTTPKASAGQGEVETSQPLRDGTPLRQRPQPPAHTSINPAFGDSRSVSLSAANEDYVLGFLGGTAQLPLQLDCHQYADPCGLLLCCPRHAEMAGMDSVGRSGAEAGHDRLSGWNWRRLQQIYGKQSSSALLLSKLL